MVIGAIRFSDVVKKLKPLEKISDREINPTVYQVQEFKKDRLKAFPSGRVYHILVTLW